MKDDDIKSERGEDLRKRRTKRERRGREESRAREAAFVERRVIPLQLVTRDRGLIRPNREELIMLRPACDWLLFRHDGTLIGLVILVLPTKNSYCITTQEMYYNYCGRTREGNHWML